MLGGTRSGDAMPKLTDGFDLGDQGRCITAASKHIVTIVRMMTRQLSIGVHNQRVFSSRQDHECLLLCPVDM